MKYDIAGQTHVGLKRADNQDAVLAEVLRGGESTMACLAVADGMGGHANGREASRRAIEAVQAGLHRWAEKTDSPNEEWCAQIESDAHRSVQQVSQGTELTGTTLTMALIQGTECVIGHVGDSRAYRFRNGKLDQLTEDHTWEAYAAKYAVENPHGKALRQAVGIEGEFEPETHRVELQADDWLILCSDGLYKMADAAKMESELAKCRVASDACVRLINLALTGGGKDNISVCVARFASPSGSKTRDRVLYVALAAAVIVFGLLIMSIVAKLR